MQAPDLAVAALQSLGLDPSSVASFLEGAGAQRTWQGGQRVTARGEPCAHILIVLSGVLKGCHNLETGAAQTVALFTPGDIIGSQALALGSHPMTVMAVTAARLLAIPSARVKSLMREDPAIAEALWRSTAREAAILQEWLVGMGRRTAFSQLAHLFCEIAHRLRLAGRGQSDTYHFPLTQTEIADVAGLSPVHVNRVLQALRAQGLIQLARGQLQICDWPRLIAAGDFDPAYLELPVHRGSAHAPVLLPSGNGRRS